MNFRLSFSLAFSAALLAAGLLNSNVSYSQEDDANASSMSSMLSSMSQDISRLSASADSNEAVSSAVSAQTAVIDAKLALLKAQYGSVDGSSMSNEVSSGTISSAAEGELMATHALDMAARRAADKIVAACRTEKCPRILAVSSTSLPDEGVYYKFKTDLAMTDTRFTRAENEYQGVKNCGVDVTSAQAAPAGGAGPKMGITSFTAPLSVAGLVIDQIAKLGSYAASSYGYSAMTVSVDSDAYLDAVAGDIASNKANIPVYMQGDIYGLGVEDFDKTLTPYQTRYMDIVLHQAQCEVAQADVKKVSTDQAKAIDALYSRVIADMETAKTSYDQLLNSLITPVDGKMPIVEIVQLMALESNLTNDKFLKVSGKPVAAVYTKKSMWSFVVGGPQLYASGGANLFYRVTDAKTGQLLTSGIEVYDAGYKSLKEVETAFGDKQGSGSASS